LPALITAQTEVGTLLFGRQHRCYKCGKAIIDVKAEKSPATTKLSLKLSTKLTKEISCKTYNKKWWMVFAFERIARTMEFIAM
jgi:uncharacterized protein with PIN domain